MTARWLSRYFVSQWFVIVYKLIYCIIQVALPGHPLHWLRPGFFLESSM
jgi:hypothetical protein